MDDVRLSALIAPPFYDIHEDVKRMGHAEYWLAGGRGSCKSTFVSVEPALGLLADAEANAIIYRKVADTLRDSVYAQMIWALDRLCVLDYWQCKVSPMELIYKPTGQRVVFRGADDPQKSKGIKLQKGYFKYLWFEELTEFDGMEAIRTIKASVIRGTGALAGQGAGALTFYTYNPPMSAQNWVNAEAVKPHAARLSHRSDYLGVPPDWLGATFIADAEALKVMNERAYRHMYLGEVTGTGGEVFQNVRIRPAPPEEWSGFPTYCGLDFGFATDPDTFVRCAYHRKRRRLFIVDEFVATGQLTDALAEAVRPRCGQDVITCDSAEPRSFAQVRVKGLRVTAAKKGPDSVAHGLKWLQTLAAIVIDPGKCPFAAGEFSR